MSNPRGKMRLGAFLMATGHHVAAWRHPDSVADAGVNFAHQKLLVQAAEAAKLNAEAKAFQAPLGNVLASAFGLLVPCCNTCLIRAVLLI